MSDSIMYHKFCSSLPSCRYIFKNGTVANFAAGEYYTDVESEIAELSHEVKLRHPHISIKAGEEKVASEDRDPLAKLRKKIIQEYEESKARSETPRDMGNSESAGKGASTSASIAPVAAGAIKVGK